MLNAIKQALQLTTEVKITRVQRGSVKLTIELTTAQAMRLLHLINKGEFAEHGVIAAEEVSENNAEDSLDPISHPSMQDQSSGHGTTYSEERSSGGSLERVFTTAEAAKICKVSQQTIIRCFDSGQLKGFRVPGSRFRRIPRDALYRFMKENGIPTDVLENGKRRILIVDNDQAVLELISEALAGDSRFETRLVTNGFGAGMQAKEYHPDLIILDVMLPDISGQAVCELIRRDSTLNSIKILCMSDAIDYSKVDDLIGAGADDFISKPIDPDELVERICRLLDMEAVPWA